MSNLQIAQDQFPFLLKSFLDDMNAIGQYGHEKYGDFSFHARALKGDTSRGDHPRTTPEAIAEHAKEHFAMFLRGESHDHFGTRRHQLAAVAFNAMMEYYFAEMEREPISPQ
ncbi:hypothetical protein [Silvibacterium acidisoli]|uniref:hypothetical protein n=1 Tax=Acidobacteriaceae bacterium ZG23-2 TaxID=2883246 RepID=UPI00406C3E8E